VVVLVIDAIVGKIVGIVVAIGKIDGIDEVEAFYSF
jgi:hypothetical protein